MGLTAWVSFIALGLLATSCDPYPAFANYAVGLRSTGDGDIVMDYFYCPGEMIDGVRLLQVVGRDLTIGHANDRVLWEISADEEEQSGRSRLTSIILGSRVPGYTEVTRLTEVLQVGVPYGVSVDLSQSPFGGNA